MLPQVRKLLKRFPNIADPGADRIMLFVPSDDLHREPPQLLVLHLIREGKLLSGRLAAAYSGGTKLQYMYPFYIRLQRVSSQ